MRKINQLSINKRLLLVSLMPLAVMASILHIYFITFQLNSFNDSLIERGEILSKILANSSEHGMLSGSTEILQDLSRKALKETDIKSIIFTNIDKKTILQFGQISINADFNEKNILLTEELAYFRHPIFSTPLPSTVEESLEVFSIEKPEKLGYIIVVISKEKINQKRKNILISGSIATFTGIICALIFAKYLGQSITKPIKRLTRVIELLKDNDYSIKADENGLKEFKILSEGINQLSTKVENSEIKLKTEIEKLTNEHREAVTHIEKKNIEVNKAKELADEANRKKDLFLAAMSHELRTPLSAIMGYTEILLSDETNLIKKKQLSLIEQSSNSLNVIIKQILNFARIDAKLIKVDLKKMSISDCIRDSLNCLILEAEKKGVELLLNMHPEMYDIVLGDRDLITQILNNTVQNAIKFTNKGHVILFITTKTIDNVKIDLNIRIEDTGIGIPSNKLTSILEPFSQADNSIARKYGGTGLGLSIVKDLLSQMEGRIELQSRLQYGTAVTINIPLIIAEPIKLREESVLKNVLAYEPNDLAKSCLQIGLCHSIHDLDIKSKKEEFFEKLDNEKYQGIIYSLKPDETLDSKTINRLKKTNKPVAILGYYSNESIEKDGSVKVFKSMINTNEIIDFLFRKEEITTANIISDCSKNKETLQGKSILLLDDNSLNRGLYKLLLDEAGAHTYPASNAQETYNLIDTNNFDLLILDLHIPEIDGIDILRELISRKVNIPTITFTADTKADENMLFSLGVKKILTKPIRNKLFIDEVHHVLFDTENYHMCDFEHINIDDDSLRQELYRLTIEMKKGLIQHDLEAVKHYEHQLKGIKSHFDCAEFESFIAYLEESLEERCYRSIWKSIIRIEKDINEFNIKSHE